MVRRVGLDRELGPDHLLINARMPSGALEHSG